MKNNQQIVSIIENLEKGLMYALNSYIGKKYDSAEKEKLLPKIRKPQIEKNRNRLYGDFSTNFAMQNAKILGVNPTELADAIIDNILISEEIISYEVAKPAYINIRLKNEFFYNILQNLTAEPENKGERDYFLSVGEHKGKLKLNNQKILLEFVSANPTGPLHVGHGRGAAYGASLANLLRYVGNSVDCEYYVNNAGRQMDILALSVYWRYAELMGDSWKLPKGIYQGDYVIEVAKNLKDLIANALYYPLNSFIPEAKDFSEAEINQGLRDAWIDSAIFALKEKLGADYKRVFNAGLSSQLNDIEDDLKEFGVSYQRWFLEDSLFEGGDIDACLDTLEASGYLYEEDKALWFKSKEFGDDKDRVVKRENGQSTYFASDIAYHANKFARDYDLIVDIWGADHHGYIARVKAAMEALGLDEEKLLVLLVQFAVLYQNGEKVQMSTRSGEFITLRKLRELVGSDAARFFYVMKKPDRHMDFDLDLATSNSKDNPYYYVQYAHARTCRVFEKAADEGKTFSLEQGLENRELLDLPEEIELISLLNEFELMLFNAADNFAPQNLIEYLKDLATAWHKYYEVHRILLDDEKLRNARLLLTLAVQRVLRETLLIIGVAAKEKM